VSNGHGYRVTLGCEAGEHHRLRPAKVEIELGAVERDHVRGVVRLSAADRVFEGGRIFYGFDILGFTEGLTRLYDRLEGSARLHDWDGETVLCLTVINRARGRVAVGGELLPAVFWTDVVSEDRFIDPPLYGWAFGIRVTFEGLVTDQSFLPPVIAGLRRFLAETGISVRSPME
jgi:hypothetical protein